MIIGITGTSGSGKTTVCNILKNKYNAYIIDCDKIAKQMLEKGTDYYNAVVKTFSTQILKENKEVDRKKLAKIIYKDDNKRNLLNDLTSKYVVSEVITQVEEKRIICDLIVIDAPLLIESNLKDMCNIIISILANQQSKIERICKRDGIDKNLAILRLSIQPKDEFYVNNSNYIINNNNNNLNDLEKKIQIIMEAYNV